MQGNTRMGSLNPASALGHRQSLSLCVSSAPKRSVAAAAVATPSPPAYPPQTAELQQALQNVPQTVQAEIQKSVEGLQQAASSFDASVAVPQAIEAAQGAAQNAIAPFDVFTGNWFLNLMLFGVVGIICYAQLTGPKQ